LFFVGLSTTFILTITGLMLLFQASFISGGIVMGSGLAFIAPFAHFYQSRRDKIDNPEEQRKEEEQDEPFWVDCLDCVSLPTPDCNSTNGDSGGFDYDCSPDCS